MTAVSSSSSAFKGKGRRDMFLLSLVARGKLFWSKRTLAAICAGIILLIIYSSHRFAAYKMNHREWVKAPINDIERQCPPPSYAVDPSQFENSKICLTTLTDAKKADKLQKLVRWRNFDNLLEMTWPNKQSYVQKHGYYLFDESDSLDISRPPSWSKIRAAKRLLTEEACDWVFWLDADTVIMNSAKKIEDFLPTEKDILFTTQKGGSYNAGAWIIRNTKWSLEFLDTWWGMESYVQPKGLSTSGDNDALKAFLLGMDKEYFDKHVGVPPRCTFNSVTVFLTPKEADSMSEEKLKSMFWYQNLEHYHKGDFVAHVAGKNNKITTTEMLLKDAV